MKPPLNLLYYPINIRIINNISLRIIDQSGKESYSENWLYIFIICSYYESKTTYKMGGKLKSHHNRKQRVQILPPENRQPNKSDTLTQNGTDWRITPIEACWKHFFATLNLKTFNSKYKKTQRTKILETKIKQKN